GWAEVAGGILYAVTLEDDGADETATVQAIPNAVADSAEKQGQDNGVGFYTVLLTAALTQGQINTFVTANPTATIQIVGSVSAMCEDDTISETAWVAGETCQVATHDYTIVLPDNECGENRLAE